MEARRRFSDLTKQEKAKVIGGLLTVTTFLITFLVYFQIVLVEDRLDIIGLINSGTSMFIPLRLMALSFYFAIVLPSMITGSASVGYLEKRSIRWTLRTLSYTLIVTGTVILLIAVLLTLFEVLLSGASHQVQFISMSFAFLIPCVVMVRLLTLKKILKYSRKLLE